MAESPLVPDRGQHPDLDASGELREAVPPRDTAPTAQPIGPDTPAEAEGLPPGELVVSDAPATAGSDTPAAPEPDPAGVLAEILKHTPLDQLEKDPRIAGWLGDMGNRRAKALLEKQATDQREAERRSALANNDTYRLGELAREELAAKVQAEQYSQESAPFMDGVVRFQNKLPREVQQQVQGRAWGEGKSFAEGVEEYMDAVTEAMVSHRLSPALESELKKREPALRKAALSAENGSAPTPERTNGQPAGVREITDEQVDRMTLDEFDTYFDDRGRPRNGVRVRITRGVALNQR